MMRLFDIEKIVLCVFDDADEVMATQVVKRNIENCLRSCRKIMVSATSLRSVMSSTYYRFNYTIPLNFGQYYIKTSNDVTLKFNVILDVYRSLVEYGNKAIVFCSVSYGLHAHIHLLFFSFYHFIWLISFDDLFI